jgi:hypothetical protein
MVQVFDLPNSEEMPRFLRREKGDGPVEDVVHLLLRLAE